MQPLMIEPDWPAPSGVRAAATIRVGGVSDAPYGSFNLGDHVGDDPERVTENRRRLRDLLNLPVEPAWLRQVHGIRAVRAEVAVSDNEADASYTALAGVVCTVMTADCLPVLLCSRDGRRVAAVHAGWKGLAAGVIESAVSAMGAGDLLAWLGPAIGPDAFEVGEEVRDAFMNQAADNAAAFRAVAPGKWHADLYRLARGVLARLGIQSVYGGGLCTYTDRDRFFSYRRDRVTGRMATLIWRIENP